VFLQFWLLFSFRKTLCGLILWWFYALHCFCQHFLRIDCDGWSVWLARWQLSTSANRGWLSGQSSRGDKLFRWRSSCCRKCRISPVSCSCWTTSSTWTITCLSWSGRPRATTSLTTSRSRAVCQSTRLEGSSGRWWTFWWRSMRRGSFTETSRMRIYWWKWIPVDFGLSTSDQRHFITTTSTKTLMVSLLNQLTVKVFTERTN